MFPLDNAPVHPMPDLSPLWSSKALSLSRSPTGIQMLWEDPLARKAQKGPRNTKPQLAVKGSQQQLANAMSTLALTGLG